jgi:hypothetical protein
MPRQYREIESGELKVEGVHPFSGYFVIFPVATGLLLCAIVILREYYSHTFVCYFYTLRMPVGYLIMPMGYFDYVGGIFPYAIGIIPVCAVHNSDFRLDCQVWLWGYLNLACGDF